MLPLTTVSGMQNPPSGHGIVRGDMAGDHKGLGKIPRIFLALPHIIRPRPYR